jgi:hypothetical protein
MLTTSSRSRDKPASRRHPQGCGVRIYDRILQTPSLRPFNYTNAAMRWAGRGSVIMHDLPKPSPRHPSPDRSFTNLRYVKWAYCPSGRSWAGGNWLEGGGGPGDRAGACREAGNPADEPTRPRLSSTVSISGTSCCSPNGCPPANAGGSAELSSTGRAWLSTAAPRAAVAADA